MKSIFLALLGTFLLNIIDHGNSEPRFKKDEEDYTGFADKFRSLTSIVEGTVNPTYQWYHNGSKLVPPTAYGTTATKVMFFETSLASQGIYQLFVSSKMGRIFGRELKVDFIVVGKFFNKTKRTRNVVIGEQFQLECPAHTLTKHAVYKWGGKDDVTGIWFFNGKPNVLVLGDGRLFFSHITKGDVEYIKQKGGISCLLEATDNEDIRFEQSGVFELNVTGEETKSFGPNMEKIPDEEVVEGSSMLLRCIAAGYPTLTYRWEKTDLLGTTTNVFDKVNGVVLSEYNKILIIKNIEKKRHAGTYTCHASIDDGGTQKGTAKESSKVTIREKPDWEGTLITSATPNISTQHSWKCMARGDPEPEYHWYANATIMNNVSGRYTIEGGFLTIHCVSPEDNGMYQCVAKNKFGFAYQTVSLEVKVKAPEITQALSQENFVAGNTGLILCVSDALPSANHHWLFNGAKLEPNKTEKYELTARQDLLVHKLSQNDTGTYACVATNTYGKATKEKYIKVAEIMFKRRPENNTNVIEGTSFSLFCEADSNPPLNIGYRWLFDGKELQQSIVNYKWDLSTRTLTVSNAQGHESGIYECIASSPTSKKSSSATVIVRALPDPPQQLTLHGKCTDLTANLTWVISYRNPYEPLTRILIQWSMSRDTSMWYNFSDHVAGSVNGHMVKGLNPYSDIVFRVIAVNQHGMGKPSNVTTGQECKTPAAKPTVCPANVQGNSTHPHDINVTWQDVESLSHNGPGFGYIVRYKQQGSASWNEKTIPSRNEPLFTIYNTSANELWEFQVQSYNDEGTGPECPNAQARSGKEAEIMFRVRPENKTNVRKGSNFSLHCEAYSNPPLSMNYKWLHEGKELSQTGMTYTVSESRHQDSGRYECVAYVKTSIYHVEKRSTSIVVVRGPPDAPRDLALSGKCSNFSANLTWTIDRRSYQALTNFTIQWNTSRDTSTWYDVTDHVAGSANGHVVRGLNPYSDIVFRVIAVNEYGQSAPSDSTSGQECKTPQAKPTVCPANVQGNSTHPHDINVTWQDVESLSHNGPGFGYIVRYKQQGSASWNEKTIPSRNEPLFTIYNTSANELWKFQVQSYNDEGTGPECPNAQARSGKEAEIMFRVRPENKTNVRKGSNFSLHCEAYSNPPLSMNYKWLHEGKELSQTGMTYTVSESRHQDSGRYECVAYVKTSIYHVEKRSTSTVVVRGPPDAPRDLALSGKCSNFSANLTWTIDRHSYQPFTNFTIQWTTSRDTSTWYDVTDHVAGSENGHVVRGLNPYSDIVFRVIAVNEYGQSAPSDSTSGQECKTPQAKPTVCPTDVEGSADLPHTIVISWKAVPQLYQNGPDFAYNVSYRKPGSEWQHEVVQGTESYTISNAGADQLWEFRVQSENAQGNGPECQVQQARTAREAPKSAPQTLKYKEIGADYVILIWQQMDASGIEGYQLSYWYKGVTKTRVRRAKNTCDDENNPCTSRITNPATHEYTQQNLKPFKDYTLFLQAYNRVGLGPKSVPLTLTTKEGRPGPPEHVKVTSYGRYLNMTWKPPAETNGVIIGYVLRITNGTNITVDGYTRAYLFKDLEPLKEYVVHINARTSAGVGNTLSKMVSTTEMRVPAVANPPHVRGVEEDSVNVTYNPSTQPGGFPEKFYIVYKEKGQDDKYMKATNVTLIKRDGEKSYIVINGLKNDKHYMFATVVMNGNKKSDRSDFTEGHPLLVEGVSEGTPVYRQFWFYIILGVILLILLLLLLLLFIRRKPKRTYKVGEREKKRAVNGSIEMGEENLLKDAEANGEESQGKTYDPIKASKDEVPEVSRDSLDEYDGSDDDFSEHGSFIGQYGNGKKPGASQSSLPSYV